MAEVTVRNVMKRYGSAQVIHGVNVDIADGEFVVLVGPSGCGKSTLLRMIAGLEAIRDGEISIGGRVVNDVLPKDRDIAMVFQSYALYPHKNVADNIGFSLKIKGSAAGRDQAKVKKAAGILDLGISSTGSRSSCPAASASVLPWAAPSCAIRRSFCSTSRFRISTPSCAWPCASRSRNCISGWAPRSSTSRTTRSRR